MAISVLEFQSRPLPTNDWIIEGLLTRRNTAFIMGQPKKATKSWLLLNAAWSLSEGKAIWGIEQLHPTAPLRTVYFTQEDTEEDIQKRVMLCIGEGHRVPNDRLWVVPKNLNIKLDTPEGRYIIKRELDSVVEKAGPIDLVVFDPMRRMYIGEENDSSTIAQLWHWLEGIHNDYNCSTLISHHIKKPPNDRSTYDPTDPFTGRGSGDIYGGGDAFVMVVPGEMSADGVSHRLLNLYFESKRGGQIPSARLKMRFTDGQVECLGRG
jgi:RecA-family ATPase